MPQLNPSPWFPILILSWLILLTTVPKKILAHFFPNELTSRTEKIKTKPWNWLWH